MSVGGTYKPNLGAKAHILQTCEPIHSMMDQAAENVRRNAHAASVSDGHPCKYNTNHYVDGKGFHHANAFISWKDTSNKRNAHYFTKALNHLRNSL